MIKKCLITIGVLFFMSCDSKSIFSEYQTINNGWKKNESIDFSFSAPDTISKYHLFIQVRNDEKYGFSNLFLITHMNFPNGDVVSDTLEYEMAKPNGEWLGTGFSSVKESKLWYKENVIFPNSGEYNIQIEHAMRINGSVDGINSLSGIKDVGIKIEKATLQ